ncbi:hypothetical protein C2S53_000248 [Perilla frutescens var. hirtella]|uniref:F-box domain-containing protein n=1 Tax=Perilla frutescens var. hirtella TaxID=608512 RepID=A0AAD4JAN3_PERFH|nr:hypothetical protein C2S53_000248 [Perilla frutescens var. hirtella]
MEQHNNIDGLPADICEEILLMLPVKTLSRFKCVCKQWRDLIESRSFTERHYRHESNEDRLFYNLFEIDVRGNLPSSSRSEEALLFSYLDRVIHFMGPANGLFCEINSRGEIIMLNPAMREIKAVPPLPPLPPLPWHGPTIQLRGLTFGFGLDPFTGDCKIVAFYRDLFNDDYKNFVCVYNSSSDSWKFKEGVEWVDSMKRSSWSESETFLNGVYYWLVLPFDDGGSFSILAFDMRTERFREIQVPPGLQRLIIDDPDFAQTESHMLASQVKMVANGDSIALMWDEYDEWVDLWVMGEEQGSWIKYFRITHIGYNQYKSINPICMWKNEVLFDTFKDSVLILRDVSTHNFRIIKAPFKHHKYYSRVHVHSAFSYKESLVSIKGLRVLS